MKIGRGAARDGREIGRGASTLIKKKIEFSSYIRQFRVEQL
jgi:hypothetical protein